MAYRNTLQADALNLVANKLQSSLAVEGEPLGDGLDACRDDGDDLMLAPARRSSLTRRTPALASRSPAGPQVAPEAEALLARASGLLELQRL